MATALELAQERVELLELPAVKLHEPLIGEEELRALERVVVHVDALARERLGDGSYELVGSAHA